MKKLETLNEQQEAILVEVADRYLSELTRPPPLDLKPVLGWLEVAYRIYDLRRPERVEVVASPLAALKLATELTGEPQSDLDLCGVGDGGWLAFYECFERFGVLSEEESEEVRKLRAFGRVAWDSVLLDECAIVIRRPKALLLDDDGNMHSSTGPAIEWADGEKDFAYHGTWIPERMVLDPRSYTRGEYFAITNTEERRALSEIGGWDWVMRLLNGKLVDTWTDPTTKLSYELLSCEGGQKLLRKQSPPLENGSQPFYFEPVHEDLRSAKAARKWQATALTPAECEADPELVYGIES